jgi:23S rRNA pseudouridine1911/1915/1917 synthase
MGQGGMSEILTVEAQEAGERLDRFLARRLPQLSRSRLQALIRAGRVARNGTVTSELGQKTKAGETYTVEVPDPEPAVPLAQAIPLAIVHEDADLLVIDKPAGLVVHPGAGHAEGTLVQLLAGRVAGGADPDRPGLVHRLDRDTSGLLVLARDDASQRTLAAAIERRTVEREYLALVEGRPPARTGTIDAPLGRDRRVRTRMSVDTDTPREARTHFALERALPSTTLLRVWLETGRTHQIRAHLRAIDHPVAGDPEYGTAGLLGL